MLAGSKGRGILLGLLFGTMIGLVSCGVGSGTSGGNQAPPPPQNQEYLFTAATGSVLSFKVDSTTGALGTPVSANGPAFSEGMVSDAAGKFLYVADMQNDLIYAFSISSTGVLSQINGSPYTVGTPAASLLPNGACGLVMDSTGKFLYAADSGNNVVVAFNVDNSTGQLTRFAGSPFGAGSQPTQLVVDNSNKFVFVADYDTPYAGAWAFSRDTVTGALTPVPGSSPIQTFLNGGLFGITTHGNFLYANEQNENMNNVVGFSFDGMTGSLTRIAGANASAGSEAIGSILDRSGAFLYVPNYGDSTISVFKVNADGSLSSVTGSNFATTGKPYFLAIDQSGKFLYASNPDASQNTITGFTINPSTGAVTQFSGTAPTAGSQPVSLTVVSVPQ